MAAPQSDLSQNPPTLRSAKFTVTRAGRFHKNIIIPVGGVTTARLRAVSPPAEREEQDQLDDGQVAQETVHRKDRHNYGGRYTKFYIQAVLLIPAGGR